MNVIWIVADTFRWDRIGAYGNNWIRTPALDELAAKSVRFDRHYVSSFPTVPARADHHTGLWTMSFMGWEPLPAGSVTLAETLSRRGYVTAAVVDTPFYVRSGMNYDQGFQGFFFNQSQDSTMVQGNLKLESQDLRAAWRSESDHAAPKTFTWAMRWLERHYKENFFLYIDTWDPHEPWDAPAYYTEQYMPDYDGEIIAPLYNLWQDVPGFTEAKVKKAHASYCGEVTMVDTWIGYLMRRLENMGLMENTAIIFTTDHGFLFGEHGGHFGKMVFAEDSVVGPDGWPEGNSGWGYDPMYEEVIHIPLLVYIPGTRPGIYDKLTSAVDVMPTVLQILNEDVPEHVQGDSLLPRIHNLSLPGREFVVSGQPFSNPGGQVKHVDDWLRWNEVHSVSTITTEGWSLIYAPEAGKSKLYNLASDPRQERNVVKEKEDVARDMHEYLVKFMGDTRLSEWLKGPRMEFWR